MLTKKHLKFIGLISFCVTATADALPTLPPWYVALNAGVFQGNFDAKYNDKTDAIAQNVQQPVTQFGYSGGIGIGYTKRYLEQYLLGGEALWNVYSSNATFSSGAASLAFTDKLVINHNLDLAFVPGFFVTDTLALYAKAGASYASISSTLTTPTGFTPTYVTSKNDCNTLGVVLGLGVKKLMTDHLAIVAEYVYHDYGVNNFPDFQNFSATYSHTSRTYSQNMTLGIHYAI